jgi:hypothetical protein
MNPECPKYRDLREAYQAAVKRWVHSTMGYDLALDGQEGVVARKRLQQTLQERDQAAGTMVAHESTCPICKRNRLEVISGPKDHP